MVSEDAVGAGLEAAHGAELGHAMTRRPGRRETADEIGVLVVESCVSRHACDRAIYAGIDVESGELVVRFSHGLPQAGGRRLSLAAGELPLVRGLLQGRVTPLDASDLVSWLAPAAAECWILLPLAATSLAGAPGGEFEPHCPLHDAPGHGEEPCYLQRAAGHQGILPWAERIVQLCPGCPAFEPAGLVLAARGEPFDERELERLQATAGAAGQRARAIEIIEKLEQRVARLQKKQAWLDMVMVSGADPIVVTSTDNRLVLQNRRAEELLVSAPGDSPGRRRAVEINDMMFSAYLSSLGIEPTAAPRELPLVNPVDGTDLLYEAVSMPATGEAGEQRGTVTVLRDISDLQKATRELLEQVRKARQAELAARQERDRVNMIVRSVGEPIVVTNLQNELVLASAEGERLFQADPRAAGGGLKAVRHNDVSFGSFLGDFNADWRDERKVELRLLDPQTEELRYYEVTAGKLHDERGQSAGVVSVFTDLTRLRELERRRIEQRLFESEKLAATGRLAASIAHEMNNPLESIKNSLYLLAPRLAMGDPAARFLEIAQAECERVGRIVKQFLGIYRPTTTTVPIDLNEVLEDELRLLDNQLGKRGIEVTRALGQVPPVRGIEDHVKQVMLNLILNAIEAMPRGGTLAVSTRLHARPTAVSAIAPAVLATIADSGPGIPADQLDQVFEPFFTTKEEAGTGLGLWVSHGIVKAHGGDIQVESAPGAGTQFHVLLPAYEAERAG